VNRTRDSIIDAVASTLLVVFGSALAATAVFFVIERRLDIPIVEGSGAPCFLWPVTKFDHDKLLLRTG